MDYKEIYAQKMNKASNLSEEILEELALTNIASARAKELMVQMKDITNRDVFSDFNFKTGAVIGILRHIAQNKKYQDELLSITGLSVGHIEFYRKYAGNLPYCDPKTNVIVEGRKMNCEKMQQFIPIVASVLGILINEDDISDINDARWEALTKRAMENALETAKLNLAADKDIVYDE